MELKDVKVPQGMLEKELVALVKDIYPKYDKALHSKAKRPQQYGIQLCSDAIQAICTKLGIVPEAQTQQTTQEQQKPRKADNRSLPCRIS